MNNIELPKDEGDTGTGTPTRWIKVDIEKFDTAKEQWEFSWKTVGLLSKELKKVDVNLKIAERKVKDAEKSAEKTLKIAEKTRDLVIIGFFVLLFMLAGLVFTYWQFMYTEAKNNYNSNVQSQLELTKTTDQLQALKNCLKNGGYKSCF